MSLGIYLFVLFEKYILGNILAAALLLKYHA